MCKGCDTLIVKSSTDKAFTKISNQAINDTRLSDRALATLTYLMSRPSDWCVYATQIAKRFGCTRKTAQIYLNELINAGYAQRRDQQHRDGKTAYDYNVSDNPDSISSGSFLHTTNIAELNINMETKRCLDDLKQYMSMYNLKADAPMADIKPYIKQIIKAGTTSKVFALFALDYMHGFKGTIDIKAFAADAVKTLTYYSEPQCRYKFDDRYLIDCDDIY